MRVLLDANILISYLLQHRPETTIAAVVRASLTGAFTLLVPGDLLEELMRKVSRKAYLADRISASEVIALVDALLDVGEATPKLEGPLPAVTRDQKDDYLLAYALAGQADYLVTGDRDLLALGEVAGLKIASPAGFLEVLGDEGWAAGTSVKQY